MDRRLRLIVLAFAALLPAAAARAETPPSQPQVRSLETRP